MSDSVDTVSLAGLLDEFDRIVDALQEVSLTCTTDEELLAAHREFERLRRRLDPVEYRLVGEETTRKLPDQYQCRSTGRFLRHLLKIEPGEANARARAAQAAGPRRSLIGEALGPVFEQVAAAQAAGVISQRHALVIEKTIDALPDAVQAEHGDQAERELVAYASRFDPTQLSVLARRMADHLDPDGKLTEPAELQRRRGVSLRDRVDGSGRIEGELTPELMARLLACFDTFARPRPADEQGVTDTRTRAQRQHDALLELLEFAQRAEHAPSNNGVSMSIVLTMPLEQYLTGEGLCRTSHGALVPAKEALSWSGGDVEVLAVVLNSMKAITHYSSIHRIFSRNQRLVMAARDKGCTFPGCPEPPGRCQTDHVPRWEHSGTTRVDRGVLGCHYHHRTAEKHGWRPVLIHGIAHWVPPKWIDPDQKPQRNTLHDTNPAA